MALTPKQIDDLKSVLFDLIPEDGRPIGNKTVRLQFKEKAKKEMAIDSNDDDYWAVRNALLADGKVRTGRGNGGAVARVIVQVAPAKQPVEQKKYKDEGALYPVVRKTIIDSWVKNYEIDDFVCQETANQGGRNTGGKWTRPDITLVAVRVYPFVPGKSIEVISFEIKPWNYLGVDGVFETASHSAFAHRSYLMIHAPGTVDESEAFGRLQREAERFGVGLVTFEDPTDWDSYNIRLEGDHRVPDPASMCQFISEQLTKDNQGKIQRMIR